MATEMNNVPKLEGAALAQALAAAMAAQTNPEVAAMASRVANAAAQAPDIVADYVSHQNGGASVFARLKGAFNGLQTEAEARMLQHRITAAFEQAGVRPGKEQRKALGSAYKEPAPFLLAKQHTSRIVAAFAKGIEGWASMTLPQLQDATRDPMKPDDWRTMRQNLSDAITDARKRLRKGGLGIKLEGLEGDNLSKAQANKARAEKALASLKANVTAFLANVENAVREMPKLDADNAPTANNSPEATGEAVTTGADDAREAA